MLGLTPTPSGLGLGDVEKENRKKGYSTGYRPKGKLHTSPEENEKQVFSELVGLWEATGPVRLRGVFGVHRGWSGCQVWALGGGAQQEEWQGLPLQPVAGATG